MDKFTVAFLGLILSSSTIAADAVPYTVNSVKASGAGFLELVAPGKFSLDGETFDYEGTWYINVKNIDSMSTVNESSRGCLLRYSSESYTETITLTNQSCLKAMSEIQKSLP